MNDVQRRGNESHLYREHPFVKGTAEVGAYLPLGQRRAHRESIAQGTTATPPLHHCTQCATLRVLRRRVFG